MAITSLTFIFDWVPLPVCHITNGNWSSCCLFIISSQAFDIASFLSFDSTPSSKLVCAAAFFNTANAYIISKGMLDSGPILKLFLLLSVCAPQSFSVGTLTSPIVSFSILYFILNNFVGLISCCYFV